MTPSEFQKLTVFRQVELLLDRGQQLMGRIYMYYNVHLFVLEGLFVEIWYKQTSNLIDRVVVLEPDTVLDLYESQIGIEGLPGISD